MQKAVSELLRMTTRRLVVTVAVLLGLAFFTACETDAPKKTSTVPTQAKAPEVTAPAPQQNKQQAKVQEPAKPKPTADPAEALIAQAEKLYQAGQANYQAGHLEAGKASSAKAFNYF